VTKLLHKDLQVYSFKTQDEFYDWLSKNYQNDVSFWLRLYKKHTSVTSVSYSDAVDVALCWGWIDGLTNRYDDESYVIRFTPRRKKSVWSKVNVEKVARLQAEGKMQPSGLACVTAAQADGRWDAAYAGQATIQLPREFIKLLKSDKDVWLFYESLNKANKYAIAYRLATVVGENQKQTKMQKLFEMLQQKKTFH